MKQLSLILMVYSLFLSLEASAEPKRPNDPANGLELNLSATDKLRKRSMGSASKSCPIIRMEFEKKYDVMVSQILSADFNDNLNKLKMRERDACRGRKSCLIDLTEFFDRLVACVSFEKGDKPLAIASEQEKLAEVRRLEEARLAKEKIEKEAREREGKLALAAEQEKIAEERRQEEARLAKEKIEKEVQEIEERLALATEQDKMAEEQCQAETQLAQEKIEKEAQEKVATAKAVLRSVDDNNKLAILKNAINNNDTAIVKFHIEAEAISQIGNELLAYASGLENRIDLVKLLLKAGFKFDFKYSQAPLLNTAVEQRNIEVVRLLLDQGAPINSLNALGQTPLIIATSLNDVEAITLLLDKGADIEAANMNGYNPLMVAAEKGHVQAIQRLLDKGAYIDTQNFYEVDFGGDRIAAPTNMTALMYAARWGQVSAVEELVKRGADLYIKNKDGQTAFDIAQLRSKDPKMAPFVKIMKILEAAMKAKPQAESL